MLAHPTVQKLSKELFAGIPPRTSKIGENEVKIFKK